MPQKSRGGAGGRRGAGSVGSGGRLPARNDAEEALHDAQAEMDDTAAALNGGGESAAPEEPPTLPAVLLQRRLDKQKKETETAINQKEKLQKQLDAMAAELALAKASVGDVVPIATPPAPKVHLNFCAQCITYPINNVPD
jgi:hypothetical protein